MRRSFQFSLRTLLLVAICTGVWLGIYCDRVRRQREACAAIKSLGGYVVYRHENADPPVDMRVPKWFCRSLGKDFFADVTCVGFMPGEVKLGPKGIGPKRLEMLRDLPMLEELFLEAVPTSPRDLEIIKTLKRLRFLTVNWQSVSLDQARELDAALPECEIDHFDHFVFIERLNAARSKVTWFDE